MKKLAGLIFGLICLTILRAAPVRMLDAVRLEKPVTVDGVLDETVYRTCTPGSEFVQLQPYNGRPAMQPTSVWVFYDEQALYVSAMLFDNQPDSIFTAFTERDNTGTSDYFGVYIDPYAQGQLSYGFYVTAAGVQVDMKAVRTGDGDTEYDSWDAVWESKTRLLKNGWSVEMRIPYSALRFSEKAGSSWGVNFYRNIRRYNSNNSWNPVDRTISGFIHQQGRLNNLKDIRPPMRLSMTPYLSGYVNHSDAGSEYMYKGGLDVKYGLSESFTLDMMLIPDFGQVQSDDKELNLTPYETYFSEKRAFFTEGMELFDRGGIFYSRRIGGAPKFSPGSFTRENEIVTSATAETQLINSSKVSGRTSSGWGVGMLNAVSLPAWATLRDTLRGSSRKTELQPLTNNNVAVVDKTLKNNSFVSLINTSQTLFGSAFRSNATATEFVLKNNAMSWALSGRGVVTLRGDSDVQSGFAGSLGLDKAKGAFRCGVSQSLADNRVNYNDLGYMRRNNECISEAYFSYQKVDPFSIFRDAKGSFSVCYASMYKPLAYSGLRLRGSVNANFMNNWFCYLAVGSEAEAHDYYEPRTAGLFQRIPAGKWVDLGINTDWRKPMSFSLFTGVNQRSTTEDRGWYLNAEGTYRLGRHFKLNYESNWSCQLNEHGFYDFSGEGSPVFAKRNVRSLSNVMETSCVLNNHTSLNIRTRHYWSSALNTDYESLGPDGRLDPLANFSGANQNYNSLTMDAYFRWIFAPGSELVLAWKSAGQSFGNQVMERATDNLSECIKNPSSSLSVRLLYYIDYNSVKTLFKG